jgi:hypothetical protein
MKAQILKIAGVKTEAEFYKKFPSEEAFMKKHGKKLKKAQDGVMSPIAGLSFNDISGIGNMIKADKTNNLLSGIANSLGPIIGNVQDINQTNREIKEINAFGDIANVVKQASSLNNKPQPRKIDYNAMRSQTVNPLGVGTNYLAAKNGAEIQNTYAPLDIYDGLGYEPLNDSNVKQFQSGGGLNLDPFSGIAGMLGGSLGSATGKGTGRGGAASSIGSSVGGIAGNFLLPGVGGAVGSLVGGFAGGLFDANQQNKLQMAQDKLTSNVNQAAMQSGAQAFQAQNSSFMEDGGWVSNDWMPQTITKFGDYSMDQLLAPPNDADMLRSGGHLAQVDYTPPSARAMYTGRTMDDGGMMHSTNMMFDTDRYPRAEYGTQMAMGGDLQVHRGEAETLSYNPFLPGGGETVMFRGPSHDDGGMPISFGQNGVEVEGGEPAAIMQDGGQQENLVVYGNMIIPSYGVEELGDKKAKGKKFKNYVADLSKVEAKQNKIIDKSTKMVDDMNVATTFDKISMQAAQANIMGATAKLKDIAEKKKVAAYVQNAILETAEENGLESDALAKGKIVKDKEAMKKAMFGAKMETAQDGKSVAAFIKQLPFAERKEIAKANGIKDFKGTADQNKKLMGILNQVASDPGALQPVTLSTIPETLPSSYISGMTAKPQQAVQASSNLGFDIRNILPKEMVTPKMNAAVVPYPVTYSEWDPSTSNYLGPEGIGRGKILKPTQAAAIAAASAPASVTKSGKQRRQFPLDELMTGVSSMVPFLRPTSQLPLDPSQLVPEMMALSMNQLEPVQAQLYNPMLQAQPYRVSLQDQRNEVIAQQRAAERMAYGNPAAAAMIAAGASSALNKINAEEFRANQAETMRAGEANRAQINDAQLKNLGILDQQFTRQAEARSKTRTQAVEVAKSVADKINQNRLENRKQAIMENMYPAFSFTKSGVAYKNPAYLANLNAYGSGSGSGSKYDMSNMVPKFEADESGRPQIVGYETKKTSKTEKRNGSIVKAIKGL